MATREISATLKLNGEAEFKKQLNDANREMRVLTSELKASQSEFAGQANSLEALTAKYKVLKKQQEQQEEITKKLGQAVEDAAEKFGENSRQVDDLKTQYNNARKKLADFNAEVDENEKLLDEAEKSADHCAASIDGYGKKVKASGEAAKPASQNTNLLEGAFGKLNLKGLAVGTVLKKVIDVVGQTASKMIELVEETNELRTGLSKLETSAELAGAAMGAGVYDSLIDLYGITGDFDSAMETLTNLFAAGVTGGEELAEVISDLEGAAIKYQQTIKTESLAESIQEFVGAGELTGQFSELMSREGVLVKYTELAADCRTETERLDLVMQAFSAMGMAEVASGYKTANAELTAYNEAQARLELAKTNKASARGMGLATWWTNFKAGWNEMMTNWSLGIDALTLSPIAEMAGAELDELQSYLRNNTISLEEWCDAVAESDMSFAEYWDTLKNGVDACDEFDEAHQRALASLEDAAPSVESAMASLEDLKDTYDSIRSSIDSVVSGFADMTNATDQYDVSAEGMIAALKSQEEYLANYQENLQAAVDAGLAPALVQQLSDGSAESAAYLEAIASAGAGTIESLNNAFFNVEAGKQSFVNAVSEINPEFSAEMDAITETLISAIEEWNQYDEAFSAGNNTIEGYRLAVDQGASSFFIWGEFLGNQLVAGLNSVTGGSLPTISLDGYHAAGLNYVPYNGYIAELHRGERVLTARQAREYSASGGGGSSVVINVSAPSLNQSQVDYLIAKVNRELGGAL